MYRSSIVLSTKNDCLWKATFYRKNFSANSATNAYGASMLTLQKSRVWNKFQTTKSVSTRRNDTPIETRRMLNHKKDLVSTLSSNVQQQGSQLEPPKLQIHQKQEKYSLLGHKYRERRIQCDDTSRKEMS